ncbi:hypothetical protein [Thiohalorhabdus methylotrophus]|uniref:Lipoprotein n=1 Tax=Thiohalorhabdus methylotrophus TaxID=3242694 RepID=A0ABV4TR59_9GAMM
MRRSWLPLSILTLLAAGCGGSGEGPGFSQAVKKQAVSTTRASVWVEEAHMTRKDDTFVLSLRLSKFAKDKQARYAGAQFVRQLRDALTEAAERSPKMREKTFAYKITVRDWEEHTLLKGSKSAGAERVAWRHPAPRKAREAVAEQRSQAMKQD